MPAIHVERSISISTPASHIHKILADYETWPTWSPWLGAEKSAIVNCRGTAGEIGHGYDWTGKVVGAGDMTLVGNAPQRLVMDLKFLKPFKSFAKVHFTLEEESSGTTRVTWDMDSSLPFFLFFMSSMMKSMIGNDYKRGLLLLKEFAETGSVTSNTEVLGVTDIPELQYIGNTIDSTLDNIGDSMATSIPALYEHLSQHGVEVTQPPLSLYNKLDMKTGSCNYTAAFPVGTNPEQTAAIDNAATMTYSKGNITAGKAFKVTHTGNYQHLGNAWSAAYMHIKAEKLKASKTQSPYEVYVSDPGSTEGADLVTEIYIPLR